MRWRAITRARRLTRSSPSFASTTARSRSSSSAGERACSWATAASSMRSAHRAGFRTPPWRGEGRPKYAELPARIRGTYLPTTSPEASRVAAIGLHPIGQLRSREPHAVSGVSEVAPSRAYGLLEHGGEKRLHRKACLDDRPCQVFHARTRGSRQHSRLIDVETATSRSRCGCKQQRRIERRIIVGDDYRALDHVLELADVAGVLVVEQRGHRPLGEARNASVVNASILLEHVVHKERN